MIQAPSQSTGAAPANEGAAGASSARTRAARIVATLCAIGAALVALIASREAWRPERELLLARGSGWLACGMLLVALAVTAVDRVVALSRPRGDPQPASPPSSRQPEKADLFVAKNATKRLFPQPAGWPLPAPVLRRALGMGAAWLACAHALVAVSGRLEGHWHVVLESAQLIAGLTALGVLVLLLLTSFEPVIRASKLRAWKELHRLAYAAALLVAQHVLLGPFASRRLALGLLLAVVVLLALRLLPRRRSRA